MAKVNEEENLEDDNDNDDDDDNCDGNGEGDCAEGVDANDVKLACIKT